MKNDGWVGLETGRYLVERGIKRKGRICKYSSKIIHRLGMSLGPSSSPKGYDERSSSSLQGFSQGAWLRLKYINTINLEVFG